MRAISCVQKSEFPNQKEIVVGFNALQPKQTGYEFRQPLFQTLPAVRDGRSASEYAS